MHNLEYINQNPKLYVNEEDPVNICDFLTLASFHYYNSNKHIISDTIYDIIYDTFKSKYPTHKFFNNIGSDVTENKIKIPVFMGSQNKIKTHKELNNWLSKNNNDNYLITPKLDGSSALVEYLNGEINLYSRGNGSYGKNLNHLVKYLNLPKLDININVRGELIVSKSNFQKFDGEYSSPRNMVNSLTSNKEVDKDKIKYLDFVVFELYDNTQNLENKLELTEKFGFKTVLNEKVDYQTITLWESIKSNFLLKKLNYLRDNYIYNIDGIIITNLKANKMNKDGNPKYSVAFKSNNYGCITTIKDIEWNISKHGLIIPRIHFEKIKLSGSNVEYCSGKTAKYVFNNCLNKGSKIRVILSGEIIPKLEEIISSSHYPLMPDKGYKWDDNRVNLLVLKEDDDQTIKKIMFFLKTINITNIGIGNITKIYESGYNSIDKFLKLSKEDLIELDGFKETLSTKIIENIKGIISKNIYLPLLMHGSCEFKYGFGVKKFEKIIEKYPNFLESEMTYEKLINVPSFNHQSASKFLENLPHFKKFLEIHNYIKYEIPKKEAKLENTQISNKNIVFTGKRDKELMDKVIQFSGIIQPAITKKTNYLVVDDITKNSVKISKAKELKIQIISKEQMYSMFN
jgi:DNA ligase (NAD+)